MAEHGPEFERENDELGLALFGLFVVLVAAQLRGRLHLPRRLLSAPEGIFLARPEAPGEGIPLAVKDLFDTAGLVTTYGSILFADHVPRETAEAVRRLEAAGYANVGKTNLHEFAYGTTSENEHFGPVPNPRYPGRIAGGSSGGSAAALAAGLADAALGSDSGGSIRIPAACCGVTGFKPTWGLVPIEGCFPLAPSYDHAGPMARDVEGCERMLQALVPGFEPTEVELDDVEVGVAWTELADPLVRARVEAAAELFPHRRRLELPLADGFYDCLQPRGRRRPPRALRRARRLLRRERPPEDRVVPRRHRRRVRARARSGGSATASSSPRRRPASTWC